MKLLILGAAGRTGTLLVDQALAAGYTVTAFVRDTDTSSHRSDVTTIVGDARHQADLEKALAGQETVISTLGSSKPGDRVIAASTRALIAAAQATKVRRVIVMSSFLAVENFKPNPIIKFALKLMGTIVADITSGEALLRQSDLEYTIVYATRLTNEPVAAKYRIVSDHDTVGSIDSISRADVADFMLKHINDQTLIKKSVLITKP